MNNQHQNQWTLADLEAYHDGELSEQAAAKLSSDLRVDPELRQQLNEIRALDQQIKQALSRTHLQAHTDTTPRWRHLLLIVAAPCAAVLVWLILINPLGQTGKQSPPDQKPIIADAQPDVQPGKDVFSPARVVYRFPARSRRVASDQKAKPPSDQVVHVKKARWTPPVETISFSDTLLTTIKDQGVMPALELLQSATPEQRSRGYAEIGKSLSTLSKMEQILDQLPPEQQLEVCQQWVQRPSLRVTAFARLTRLRQIAHAPGHEQLATQFDALIETLEKDKSLRSWLRSHKLAAGASTLSKG